MRALAKAAALVLMGFDVDGVLTDGGLRYGPEGETQKTFGSLDGHGLKLLQQSGVEVAIISGRRSQALALRAEQLGIDELHMGVEDKLGVLCALLVRRGLAANRAGYMGDDVVDLAILGHCGFSATTGDAHPQVRARVDYVARAGGGRGAVREVCDLICYAQSWALRSPGRLS